MDLVVPGERHCLVKTYAFFPRSMELAYSTATYLSDVKHVTVSAMLCLG